MFDKKGVMKKLGVVSVSALILLGVGASMSDTNTSIHADDIFEQAGKKIDHNYDVAQFGQEGAKQREKWDAQQSAASDAKIGIDPYTDSDVTSELSHNQIREIIQRSKNDPTFGIDNNNVVTPAVPKGMTRAEVTAEAEKSGEQAKEYANSQSTSVHVVHRTHHAKQNVTTRHYNHLKRQHVAKHMHHLTNKHSNTDDYIHVMNKKRHFRKITRQRINTARHQARRTRKGNKRVNLQNEIHSLKRQLRRAKNRHVKRNIIRQLNKLTKSSAKHSKRSSEHHIIKRSSKRAKQYNHHNHRK